MSRPSSAMSAVGVAGGASVPNAKLGVGRPRSVSGHSVRTPRWLRHEAARRPPSQPSTPRQDPGRGSLRKPGCAIRASSVTSFGALRPQAELWGPPKACHGVGTDLREDHAGVQHTGGVTTGFDSAKSVHDVGGEEAVQPRCSQPSVAMFARQGAAQIGDQTHGLLQHIVHLATPPLPIRINQWIHVQIALRSVPKDHSGHACVGQNPLNAPNVRAQRPRGNDAVFDALNGSEPGTPPPA